MSALPIVPTPLTCRFVESYTWDNDDRPKPGDMFFVTFSAPEGGPGGRCRTHEPPCERHLHVVTPDGFWWDIDGRANNCDMKHDKTHRCWVRHGEPPLTHVDKNGPSCHAGAGSILTDRWHGFLHHGVLVSC